MNQYNAQNFVALWGTVSFLSARAALFRLQTGRHLISEVRAKAVFCALFVASATYCPTLSGQVLSTSSTDAYTDGVYSAHRKIGCDKQGMQEWKLNSLDRQIVILEGVLQGRKHNNEHFWDDGDWNICITPDNGYTDLSVNRWGTVRPGGEACGVQVPEGTIETEVKSDVAPDWLRSRFNAGDPVIAGGYWVYDTGHPSAGKPAELHPLIWLATRNRNPTSVFVVQDLSGRFGVAGWPVGANIGFTYPSAPILVSFNASTVGPGTTDVVREDSASQLQSASLDASGVTVGAEMPAAGYCMCNLTCSYFSGGHAFDWRADLNYSQQNLLSENIQYSVANSADAPGRKYVSVTVTMRLNNPPQGAIHYSKWSYQSSTGTQIGVIHSERTDAPHELTFNNVYAPWDGYLTHQWVASVAGTTSSKGALSVVTDDIRLSDPYGYQRTFVGARRSYYLQPSRITFDWERKGSDANQCTKQVYLRVNRSRLLPQINMGPVTYRVRMVRDKDGTPANDPWHNVTAGSPWTAQDTYGAGTYSSEPDRIDVTFSARADGSPNLSEVIVEAKGETELGEMPVARAKVSEDCGLGRYSRQQVFEFINRVLYKRKYPYELYELMKHVSRPADRGWVKAFATWASGRALTSRARDELKAIVLTGSRLRPVPKEADRAPRDSAVKSVPTLHIRTPVGASLRRAPVEFE